MHKRNAFVEKMATAKAEAISQHNSPHYLLGREYFSFMPQANLRYL